jgi:hypothetical protein
MRTTVEITAEQRARLLQLAARRGEKGFSRLVQEAIDRYLSVEIERKERIEAAVAVLGTVSAKSADAMQISVEDLRGRWR